MCKVRSYSAPKRSRSTQSTRKRRAKKVVRPVIDSLERRTFLSAVTLSSGILTLTGQSSGASTLQIGLGSTTISADNGHGTIVAYPIASVKGLSVVDGNGNDTIFVDSNLKLPCTIKAGDGNDSIRSGGGANTITLGNGKDWLYDRGTKNVVVAGNGEDTILGSNNGDTITVGNGNDSIDGGSGNDVITTGNGDSDISGGAGADKITVGNGSDSINSGAGNDTVICGTGMDTVYGGSGTNTIVIGNADDVISPDYGINIVTDSATGVTVPTSSGGNSGGTAVAGSESWVKYSATKSSSSTAPQAVMEMLAPALTTGIGVDVRATASTVGAGSPITTNYQWNFGDSSGERNTLDGYNATHIYQSTGTYTVTLTVTNDLGQASTVSTKVTIAADGRKQIYVDSVNGNDSNTGTISAPLKTVAEADTKLGNNTEVLFKRGDTFLSPTTFKITYTNVLVGAYGSGADPIIEQPSTVTGNGVLVSSWYNNYGTTIEDIQFTAQDPSTGVPFAIVPRGNDETVLDCVFGYVEYAINANGSPNGLDVVDSSSPNSTGLQGYFVWGQGNDLSIIGNTAVNSVHEHIFRSSSVTDELVADNNFTNNDGKGCIEVHVGSYAWVVGNTVTNGDIRVGPLGIGEPITDITQYATVENNLVNNSSINVDPGAHDVSIRNNIIKQDVDTGLININSLDGNGRYDSDIQILNNTGIDTSSFGAFLDVPSATKGITLDNNLFVDTKFSVGAYETAAVYVNATNLSSFTQITGNVWQTPETFLSYADGGINYVGTTYNGAGYETISVWNANAVVGTDYMATTTLSSNYTPASGSVAAAADSAAAGVYTDYYGTVRPSSGKWSAGAVQV